MATWHLVRLWGIGDEWAKPARLVVRSVGKVCPFTDEAGCLTESAGNYSVETHEQVTVGRIWSVNCLVHEGRSDSIRRKRWPRHLIFVSASGARREEYVARTG